MKVKSSAALGVAAAATLSMAALAQTAVGAQSGSAAAAQQEQQVTVIGCVQREADYRRTRDEGRGGVAGTGVGAGNEFVLINASIQATGAAASATKATEYELTGPNEGKLQQYAGKRVEIAGKLKPFEVGAAGPTGGPTADKPPKGVDVVSKDLKLPEVEVSMVKEASGTCPAR